MTDDIAAKAIEMSPKVDNIDVGLEFVGVFRNKKQLEKAISEKQQTGFRTLVKLRTGNRSYWRLQFGPFAKESDAIYWINPLKKEGFNAKFIKRDLDFVLDLGRASRKADIQKTMKKAESLGFYMLEIVRVDEKYSIWRLYTQNNITTELARANNKIESVDKSASDIKEPSSEPTYDRTSKEQLVSTNYSYRVKRESFIPNLFASREKALERAKQINQGESSRAFVVKKKINKLTYFLGPFDSQRDTDSIVQRLKRSKISHQLSWDKKRLAFYIWIVESDIPSQANWVFDEINKQKIGKIPRKLVEEVKYEVVEQLLSEAPDKKLVDSQPKDVVKQPVDSASEFPGDTYSETEQQDAIFSTYSNKRAIEKMTELKRRGINTKIEALAENRLLQAIVITKITSMNEAKEIAKDLKSKGIDAFAFSTRNNVNFSLAEDYGVSVGVFSNWDNVQPQLNALKVLGYHNSSVVNYNKQVTNYRVLAIQPDRPSDISTPFPDSEETDSSIVLNDDDDQDLLVFLDTDSLSDGGESQLVFEEQEQSPFLLSLKDSEIAYYQQPDRDDIQYLASARFEPSFEVKFATNWDSKISARARYWQQQGLSPVTDSSVLLDEAFVRYRGTNYRVTLGNQKVVWGRLDGDAPTDFMSTRDLSFVFLDDELEKQRIADTSFRIESYFDQYKLDLLYTPKPRETILPGFETSFAFINQSTGRILGVEPHPIIQQLALNGTIQEGSQGESSFGLRMSYAGESIDYAITAQKTRFQTPFYAINPQTLFFLSSGNSVEQSIQMTEQPTFLAYQPETSVYGGDFGWAFGTSTLRGEVGWISDYPILRESSLLFDTTPAVSWGVGLEAYPNSAADSRLIIQLVGTQVLDDEDVLGEVSQMSLNGQWETTFLRERWRLRLNFMTGLRQKDTYFNPELSYTGLTNQEFYLRLYYFQGDDNTSGGFYEDSNTVSIGWNGTFD